MLTVESFASGGSTIRWGVNGERVRLGFIDGKSNFRAAHPWLDDIDGARLGDNIRGQIISIMKGDTNDIIASSDA